MDNKLFLVEANGYTYYTLGIQNFYNLISDFYWWLHDEEGDMKFTIKIVSIKTPELMDVINKTFNVAIENKALSFNHEDIEDFMPYQDFVDILDTEAVIFSRYLICDMRNSEVSEAQDILEGYLYDVKKFIEKGYSYDVKEFLGK